MSFTPETLLRHWQTLRLVPRLPRRVSAGALREQLVAAGFQVGKRTVERDLQALSLIFPLICDETARPYAWSWDRAAPSFDLPGIDTGEALALLMAREHLATVLPSSTLAQLEPMFKLAEAKLKLLEGRAPAAGWCNKVRVIPPTQPLLPPPINQDALAAVQEALLQDRQCQVEYRRRDAPASETYPVHPLGLVQRGQVLYLVCTIRDYQDVRLLALHRVDCAAMLEHPINAPQGFDLDEYLAGGAFGWKPGGEIKLVLAVAPEVAGHLLETPLSGDQRATPMAGGRLKVEATVRDTEQLTWWILGFGNKVQVLGPSRLQKEISAVVHHSASHLYPRQLGQE